MSKALSFNEVSLVPVPVNNNDSIWLRAADIAKDLVISVKTRCRAFTSATPMNSRQI